MKKGIPFFLRAIATLFLLAALILCIVPVKSKAIARLAFIPFEKRFQNKIDFNSPVIWLPGNISLEDVSITDKRGRLYYSKTAEIKYNPLGLLFQKSGFLFDLKGVKFYGNIGLLDSVSSILIISKMPDIEFEEMGGILRMRKGILHMADFYAHNDSMRIKGGGWVDKNGALDCDINFSFSKDITDEIPDVVKKTLLSRQGEGWMGISFKAKGNYKRPSLHITGNRLELNIIKGLLDE
jgi:hypothetical protein